MPNEFGVSICKDMWTSIKNSDEPWKSHTGTEFQKMSNTNFEILKIKKIQWKKNYLPRKSQVLMI